MSNEQKSIVYTTINIFIKFLSNDPTYKPMRETIVENGVMGKSFIINTIISMVRKLTGINDTVQIAVPLGAAAFNVEG